MKNRTKLCYISMFACCSLAFSACGDDEVYDVYGDPYNRVYVRENSQAYKLVQTPVSSVSNVDFTWEVQCSKVASGDIKVKVEVDNSLIAGYNEKNGTTFEALPEESVVMENSEMTIPAGCMKVSTPLHVTLTDNVDVLAELRSENGYLVPLRLVSAQGGNAQLSTNMLQPSYLTITVTEDNVNHDADKYAGTGVLVANQSGWSATCNGTVSSYYSPIETLFDGDCKSTCSLSNRSADLHLDIDMGKSYSFDGIKMTTFGYDYTDWTQKEMGAFAAGMTVSTKENGGEWKVQGVIENAAEACVFYAPLTAQYIRITVPNSGGWYGASLECGLFNIYEK